ncbi:MAG: hypothetical protein GY778_13745 [bacterium]|nr:hypothetical protein [bacterium]
MEFLTDLWLPILLSAVFVFVVSSILHMVIPIHRGDYSKLPGEEKVLAEMRSHSVAPGEYMFPCSGSMKDMCSPEMIEKYQQGPVGFLTVVPSGAPGMGKNLVLWFLYSVLIGVFVAYIAHLGLSPGTHYLAVFRVTGAVAVLAYGVAYIPNSIWKGGRWSTTLKFLFDGIIYGLVTGGTFGWLWPAAA